MPVFIMISTYFPSIEYIFYTPSERLIDGLLDDVNHAKIWLMCTK